MAENESASSGGVDRQVTWLLDRESALLERYRQRLIEINSPLTEDEQIWQQCVIQARRILGDIATSLAGGELLVSADHIAQVVDMAGDRVRHGVHLVHSIRAGMILLDIFLDAMLAGPCPELVLPDGYVAALRALHVGVVKRLEVGALGYDSFLLDRLSELREVSMRKLARDIHDEVGNSLSLAIRQIELFEAAAARGDASAARHATAAKAAVVETMSRTRDLVTGLRGSMMTNSLETALRSFAASVGVSEPVVRIFVHGVDEWIPEQISEELFITVRECMRNAFQHAGAMDLIVQIDIAPHQVQTEIIDNGRGFDIARVRAEQRHNGLAGMQERIELLGGRLNIESAPAKGTHVTIWVPIWKTAVA